MLTLELCFEDGKVQQQTFSLPLLVGRGQDCDLVLKSWRLARHHARFIVMNHGIFVEDMGALSGTYVNGQRISRHGPLNIADQIVVGPCLMRLVDTGQSFVPRCVEQADRMEPHESPPHALPSPGPVVLEFSSAVQSDPGQVLSETSGQIEAKEFLRQPSGSMEWALHRKRLHGLLIAALDLRRHDIAQMNDSALRTEATRVLSELLQHDTALPHGLDKTALLVQVVNEAVGLGPLEPLLNDPSITEIMVNRHDEIFVEINGVLQQSPLIFSGEQAVLGVIDRIVAPLGRRIDESSPMVDARLADGSRVNAVIPPVALRGAGLTIRKFPGERPDIHALQAHGAFDECMRQFLALCVRTRKNMVVAGGTGSGKTTLLNVLSAAIPSAERVVTIEDAAELKLSHRNLVGLEARPANLEGKGRIEIRDLVRNALRMRPDRIVVGECRGAEAFDMLAAMNTGHEGSLTTLHANSPRDALARLETMILMAGMDLPLAAVREQIASSIHFIVQQSRLPDGHRLVSSIVEVTGIESGRIQTQPIFMFDARHGGQFVGAGTVPECFSQEGLEHESLCPISLFVQSTPLRRRPSAASPAG